MRSRVWIRIIQFYVRLLLYRRFLLSRLICQTFPALLFFLRRSFRFAGFPVFLQLLGQFADSFQFLRRGSGLHRCRLNAGFRDIDNLGIGYAWWRAVAIMHLSFGIDPFVDCAQHCR
jgi:hypothetical protein